MKTIASSDGIGHEACNQTIEDLLKVVASQRSLLENYYESLNTANQTIATLNSLMTLILTSKTEKRGRGRPAKSTTNDFWLEKFNSTMKPEFIAANKFAKTTDTEVLTWWFVKEFSPHGKSASWIRGKEFQGKLKSIRNMLSDARNPIPKLPIK